MHLRTHLWQVLLNGAHAPARDEYDPDYGWSYAIDGEAVIDDGTESFRVVVALEDDDVLLVTVYPL